MKRWLVTIVVLLSMVGTAHGIALPWSLYSDAAKATTRAREIRCPGGPVTNTMMNDGEKIWQMLSTSERVIFIYEGDDDVVADTHLGIVDGQSDKIIIKEVIGSAASSSFNVCDYLYPKTI